MESPAPSPQASRALLVPLAAVLFLLILRSGWVTDDAYLTLRTADNFIHGDGLGWNGDERVQAYTHPLWMLLLTAGYALTHQAFLSSIGLGLLCTGAAVWLLGRLGRDATHALLALGLLTLSRAFVEFSTSGLENPLSHLLVAALVLAYAVRRAPFGWLCALAALLALNRMDTLLVAVPALVHAGLVSVREHGLARTAQSALLGALPLLSWELFSLVYYGFWVPNTAFAKLNTGIDARQSLAQGAVYLMTSVVWDPVLLAGLAIGVAAAWVSRDLRRQLLALGALLYVAYVVRVGGDFMAGRFLTVPLFMAACLVATTPLPGGPGLALGATLFPFTLFWLHPLGREEWPVTDYRRTGVADERQFYREQGSLMLTTRVAVPPKGAHVDHGTGLRRSPGSVELMGAVGYAGFYAGPRTHIVDYWALGDALLARLPMRYDPDWRVGHYTRVVPEGYLDTLREGRCLIKDPRLCEYLGALHEVIRGPIWSWKRFKTIARFQLGQLDALIDRDRYRHPELRFAKLGALTTRVPDSAAWDGPGMHVLNVDGLAIDVGGVKRAAAVSLRLDADDYDLVFKRAGRTLVSVTSPATAIGRRRIEVPAAAAEGFDWLVVRPRRGDGHYALGDVRLEPR
jgi:arabinofuranosyltransferase